MKPVFQNLSLRSAAVRQLKIFISASALACPFSSATGFENNPEFPVVEVQTDWYQGVYGAGIGDRGLAIGDIDQDGDVEIVVAASGIDLQPNRYWYVLSFDGTDYLHEWKSLEFEGGIDRLVVGQYDADAPLEVLISVDGDLLIFDGESRLLQAQFSTSAENVLGLATENLDGDPAIEVALCDESNTWIYDLESGDEQLAVPGIGCEDIAIGETDGTNGLEIVVVDETSAKVLDASTGVLEWNHPDGSGFRVAVEDFDGDGLDEIAPAVEWDGLSVWNGDTKTLAWDLEISHIKTLTGADVEGDGTVELIYGEGQFGQVYIRDGNNGNEKWSIPHPSYGVTRITVGDVNADGANEVVFGSGYWSGVEDYLFVVDSVSREIEWESPDLYGPFLGLDYGDIDADGHPELIYTAYHDDIHLGDGRFFIYDADSKELEYQSPIIDNSYFANRFDVEVFDVDDDPALEIFSAFVGTGRNGIIRSIDGETKFVQWEQVVEDLAIAGLEIGDPDNDGDAEVVASVDIQTTAADGVYVFMFDGNTGTQEFQSLNLEDFFGFASTLDLLRISDVDDDGTGEILVAETGEGILAIDPVSEGFDLIFSGLDITALETADVDSDNVPEIVVGDEQGNIYTVEPGSGDLTKLLGPYPGQVFGLVIKQIIGSEELDYVFASGDKIHIVDGSSGETVWLSEDLGENVGISDSLLVGDIDNDGHQEIWVSVGSFGHMVLRINIELIQKVGFE